MYQITGPVKIRIPPTIALLLTRYFCAFENMAQSFISFLVMPHPLSQTIKWFSPTMILISRPCVASFRQVAVRELSISSASANAKAGSPDLLSLYSKRPPSYRVEACGIKDTWWFIVSAGVKHLVPQMCSWIG